MINREGGDYLRGRFDWQTETKKQWNKEATQWNERSENMWNRGSRKEIIPFIKTHLQKNDHILDIGCGDGYGSHRLSLAGFDVTGMDLSEEMIELASKQHKDISFQQGSIHDLIFQDSVFDGVMAINVLEWLEDPLHGLQEIRRVLKIDGLLFTGILGPTAGPRRNSYPRIYGKNTICNTMMPWEFEKMALENGFTYIDGFGVYKKEVKSKHYEGLSEQLQQALSFMWIFCLKKADKVE